MLSNQTVAFICPEPYADAVNVALDKLGARPYLVALEHAVTVPIDEQILRAWQVGFAAVDNVLHGHPLHTHYFIETVTQYNLWTEAKSKLHFTMHQGSSRLLEIHGIPAIAAPKNARGIDLIELLIRLRRLGPSIYPTGGEDYEELPELLKELDIPVFEMKLYDIVNTQDEALLELRTTLYEKAPDAVLIHSKTLARRFGIAFPDFKGRFFTLSDQLLNELPEGIEKESLGNYRSLAAFCES